MSAKKSTLLLLFVIVLILPLAILYWPIGTYTYSNDFFSFRVPDDFVVGQDFVWFTAPDGSGEDVTVDSGYGVYMINFEHKMFGEQVSVSLLSIQNIKNPLLELDTETFKSHYSDYSGKVIIKELTISSRYPSIMAKRVYGHGNSLYDLRFVNKPYNSSINFIWTLPFYLDWYMEARVDSFIKEFSSTFAESD